RKMSVATLNGEGVERVGAIIAEVRALSIYDGFALVVAEEQPGCILLTGDRRLRDSATALGIECHGLLWVVDEIRTAKTATMKTLLKALEAWHDDPLVRLPGTELGRMITRYKS